MAERYEVTTVEIKDLKTIRIYCVKNGLTLKTLVNEAIPREIQRRERQTRISYDNS